MNESPDEGEGRGILPDEIGASLDEIFEEETAGEADPILERLGTRERVLGYYTRAVEERDENKPHRVRKLRGTKMRHSTDQDPRAYTVACYKIELLDAFSELVEPRIEEDMLNPHRAILETTEEMLGKVVDPDADQTDIRRKVMIVRDIASRYRKEFRR